MNPISGITFQPIRSVTGPAARRNLVTLTVRTSCPPTTAVIMSSTTSAEFFNEEYEHQMEEAVAYVESTLVPEPGTGMLFGLGLMGLARGSRRPRF